MINMPQENGEKLQVIHYSPGQEYKGHFDAYRKDTPKWERYCSVASGGQRLITTLTYLNDVEEGGETAFPEKNLVLKPKLGRIVIFHNCNEGTDIVHLKSKHAAMPVIKGEKWAFNIWFRQAAAKP